MIIVASIFGAIFLFIGGHFLYYKGRNIGSDGGVGILEELIYGIPISIFVGILIGLFIKDIMDTNKKHNKTLDDDE